MGRRRRRHVHGATEIKLCRASVYHLKVMIVDGGIERLLPKTYLHWLVMNVPGDKVEEGVEVFQYVTPFSLELEEDGSIVKDTKESSHPMIVLVFKQLTGKVEILRNITLSL